MALIQCDFFSEVLGMCMSMNVILPQTTVGQIGMENKAGSGKFPTLYLLHGCSDDHTIWSRRTSVERYAASLGIAIVMPNAHRSYYSNMKEGYRYWDYISEEIPALARSFFPLSDRREDNFVAGLSMGGFGAFKMAMKKPETFCAAASLSGAFGNSWMLHRDPVESRRIFGHENTLEGTEDDMVEMAKACLESGKPLPKLYQYCGSRDFVYEANTRLKEFLDGSTFDYTYAEDDGVHGWEAWDEFIQPVLKWLPVRKPDA